MEWVICLAIGAAAGIVSGVLGAAGGWFLVPALILGLPYAGVNGPEVIKIAIATSLAVSFFTSFATARAYAARGSVNWLGFWRLLPGDAIGVIGGAIFAAHADVTFLTLVFMGAAIYMAAQMAGGQKSHTGCAEPLPGLLRLSGMGLFVGAIIGTVGGGGLSVPIFARYMPIQRAIGTAAALVIPMAAIGVFTYGTAKAPQGCGGSCLGYIYLPAVCASGIAAVLFAPLGSALAHSLPVPALKRIFAAALVLAALNLGRKALPPAATMEHEVKAALVMLMPSFGLCKARGELKPVRFGEAQASAR